MTVTIRPATHSDWLNTRGASIPAGHVRIRCDDPAKTMTVLMAEDPPKLSGGFGGWEITARPRQVGMTTWGGVEPFQLTLALLLDGFTETPKRSVEPVIRDLLVIARGDGESEPGIVDVEGIPLPVDQWVIENLEFGDAYRRTSDGHATRQPVTLTLREYVPPSYMSLRRHALQGTKGKTKVITVRGGDTPTNIARRQRCKWTDVRDLNLTFKGSPKPPWKASSRLKPGSKIRVPVAEEKKRTKKGKR